MQKRVEGAATESNPEEFGNFNIDEAQIDVDSILGEIPQGTKFMRFGTAPKDIIAVFMHKNKEFMLERDEKFIRDGVQTYKFAFKSRKDYDLVMQLI